MKLFWKQFITMVCFIIMAFMVFGNIIVNASFQATLNRETKRSIEEMKIFRYALMASLEGLPNEYRASDTAVLEITKSIRESLESSNGIIIYDNKRNIIYKNSKNDSTLIEHEHKDKCGIWMISEYSGSHFTECLFEVDSKMGTYYLVISRDIGFVYEERANLYKNYRIALLAVSVIFAALSLIFSIRFTNPIIKLSAATRDFANGDFKRRVKASGNDEVAALVNDFNKMAEQLENNIYELKENARRQEEFTEAFSHELKTPLTSIIGYADMLRSMGMSEEDVLLSADYIFRQGKRLERLALKMMELSYINKQKIELKHIPVKDLTEKIERSVTGILESKNIELVTDVEEGVIYGDMDLLESLFFNLIDNARKACTNNGVIIFEGRNSSDEYVFKVKDTGCGIPADEIEKITEAFYMVDKSRARKEGGAGIGLALCMKIVQRHNAVFGINSKIGEGTSITVRFK